MLKVMKTKVIGLLCDGSNEQALRKNEWVTCLQPETGSAINTVIWKRPTSHAPDFIMCVSETVFTVANLISISYSYSLIIPGSILIWPESEMSPFELKP